MYFSLRKMKELIEEQCKYGTRDQLLLYENSLVEDLMGDQGKSDRFPCTSTENPVFLYHCIDPGNSTEDHPGKPFVRKCLIINTVEATDKGRLYKGQLLINSRPFKVSIPCEKP